MVTLYLVNQPESTWMKEERIEGISDTSLTKRGKAQATALARYLSTKQIDAIITSRLNRATQCAKIFQQFIPQKLIREQSLNDINLGTWQGKFPEEVEARYPEVWNIWKNNPEQAAIPEGGALPEVKADLLKLLQKYSENVLFPKYYLVSTHDIIVRILLCIIEDKPLSEIWKYKLDPGSISEIAIYPEKKVKRINITDYVYV